MDRDGIEYLLRKCALFDDSDIEIFSIYHDDPLEKCFLVKDVSTQKKYKVRVATKEFPKTAKSEYRAIAYLKTKDISWVPEVYFSGVIDDNELLVSDFLVGESLDKIKLQLTTSDLEMIRRKVYTLVEQLHALTENYYGDFTGNNFLNWQDYFQLKFFNHVNNACEIGLIGNNDYHIIETAFLGNLDYYKNAGSHFLHFDIKPANIIFDRQTGDTNLIDFELCRFGDKKIEYSRFITYYHNQNDELYNSLFIPLAKEFLELPYADFIKTRIFLVYNLYNLLAYYTTSYMKHGVIRSRLIKPIKDTIRKLK